jgi:hypothetical protein
MKKVAIASCYFQKNYGSALQAFATQKILDELGIKNETICVSGFKKEIDLIKIRYYLKKILDFNIVKEKLGYVKLDIYSRILKNSLKKNILIRQKKFKEFEHNFHFSKVFKSKKELAESCNEYSSVIVGSDQLWLPSNIEADYYTLNFVPKYINKISYATSFGVSEIPKKYMNKTKMFLNRIEHLSVREKSGQILIKKLTGKDAEIVCDPTMLFTAEDWMCIQKKENIFKNKYIFCYFLGGNLQHRKFAKKLKDLTGYKIVSLQNLDKYVKGDKWYADVVPYNIGPGEFINLIRNAEYICTDSFHGTVFSLLNRKKFFVFKRFSDTNKLSTNTRIESLLNLVQLQERLISFDRSIEDYINMKIDYEFVLEKLKIFREKSKMFLINSLGFRENYYDKYSG